MGSVGTGSNESKPTGVRVEQFESMLNQYNRRTGLTSMQVNQFSRELDNMELGTVIHTTENNRYYNIEKSFTKLQNGSWRYERVNHSNGQTYESREVSSQAVSNKILSTAFLGEESERWRARRKR